MHTLKRSFVKGEEQIELEASPHDLIQDPLFNKGTAFTREERKELGIDALLPYHVATIEEQIEKCYLNLKKMKEGIGKYKFLMSLYNRNEILFFRLLLEHPQEMLPIIYTPTVGDASMSYSMIHAETRGVFISYPDRDRMDEIIANIPKNRIDVTVVTDGGRVLGLGDLGIGGMSISVGKLCLYTLFGGIHPAFTLPIQLDVGTDNEALLSDPLYMGWRHKRITEKEHKDFIDQFITAITKRFPKILIQWEDFSKSYAQPLLEKYRGNVCSFNDDVQGTAAVVTAGIFSAINTLNQNIKDQCIVFYGAGSAGIGSANLIVEAMKKQGVSEKEAKDKIFVLGRKGLAHTQSEGLDDLKKQFAQPYENIANWDVKDRQNITLLEIVKNAKPTILIGTSTVPGSFSKEIVLEMQKHTQRPIIFPLSNPTSKTEAVPEDLIKWTEGRALIATGSPFPSVSYKEIQYDIGQCNNVFIFPGLGLGVLASGAKKITDTMFLKASEVLSTHAPILQNKHGALFPAFSSLRAISLEIAVAVGSYAIEEGLCQNPPRDIERAVKDMMWEPKYPNIKKLL